MFLPTVLTGEPQKLCLLEKWFVQDPDKVSSGCGAEDLGIMNNKGYYILITSAKLRNAPMNQTWCKHDDQKDSSELTATVEPTCSRCQSQPFNNTPHEWAHQSLIKCAHSHHAHVAHFTKEDNPSLNKQPLKFKWSLVNIFSKIDTGGCVMSWAVKTSARDQCGEHLMMNGSLSLSYRNQLMQHISGDWYWQHWEYWSGPEMWGVGGGRDD